MKTFIENLNPVKFFLIFATIFGLIFLFITPPFQTPDEVAHFERAYQISEGTLLVQKRGSTIGGLLPSSINKTILATHEPSIAGNSSEKFQLNWLRNAASIKLDPSARAYYDFVGTVYYTPVVYVFQSAGILIGRLANLPPVFLMYLGRLGNLLEWILLLGLAIRLTPSKKWLLVAFGLLPMSLFEAISISADSVTLSVTALSIALVLYYRKKNSVMRWKDLALLTSVFTILVLSKPVMFVLLPIVLLLPLAKLKPTKKRLIITSILIFVPLLIFLLWMAAVHGIKLTAEDPIPVPGSQFKFILTHPFGYLKVLLITFFGITADGISSSFIGNFGWLNTPLPLVWVILGYISIAFLAFVDYGKKTLLKLTRADKLVTLSTLILYSLAVSTALYVFYSPLKYPYIVGLQGRYFIPLIALALPLFAGFNYIKTTRFFYKSYAIVTLPLLLIASTITIFLRFFA